MNAPPGSQFHFPDASGPTLHVQLRRHGSGHHSSEIWGCPPSPTILLVSGLTPVTLFPLPRGEASLHLPPSPSSAPATFLGASTCHPMSVELSLVASSTSQLSFAGSSALAPGPSGPPLLSGRTQERSGGAWHTRASSSLWARACLSLHMGE